MQLSYRYEEADAFRGGSAASDEARDGNNTPESKDCHCEPVNDDERKRRIVQQENAVEQTLLTNVNPQTNADQHKPTQLHNNTTRPYSNTTHPLFTRALR